VTFLQEQHDRALAGSGDECSVIFYGPRDPTKLPAAPRVGQIWTPRLVGMLSDRLSNASCRVNEYRLNEDIRTSKNNRSKCYSTDSWLTIVPCRMGGLMLGLHRRSAVEIRQTWNLMKEGRFVIFEQ
jgi:hypothetical protein